jgi:hypothetical protein
VLDTANQKYWEKNVSHLPFAHHKFYRNWTGNLQGTRQVNNRLKSATGVACVTSGFRRHMNEVFGFLGCYAALESS